MIKRKKKKSIIWELLCLHAQHYACQISSVLSGGLFFTLSLSEVCPPCQHGLKNKIQHHMTIEV